MMGSEREGHHFTSGWKMDDGLKKRVPGFWEFVPLPFIVCGIGDMTEQPRILSNTLMGLASSHEGHRLR
jgi:hypothetical protein